MTNIPITEVGRESRPVSLEAASLVTFRPPSKVDTVCDQIAGGVAEPRDILLKAKLSPSELLALSMRLIVRSPEERSERYGNAIAECSQRLEKLRLRAEDDNSAYLKQLAFLGELIDSSNPERTGVSRLGGEGVEDKARDLATLIFQGSAKLKLSGHSRQTLDALSEIACNGPSTCYVVNEALEKEHDLSAMRHLFESALISKPEYASKLLEHIRYKGFPKVTPENQADFEVDCSHFMCAVFDALAIRMEGGKEIKGGMVGPTIQEIRETLVFCMKRSPELKILAEEFAGATYGVFAKGIETRYPLAFSLLDEAFPFEGSEGNRKRDERYKSYVAALGMEVLDHVGYLPPLDLVRVASIVSKTSCQDFWETLSAELAKRAQSSRDIDTRVRNVRGSDGQMVFNTKLPAEPLMILAASPRFITSSGNDLFQELYDNYPPESAAAHQALLELNPLRVLRVAQLRASEDMRPGVRSGSPHWYARGVPLHHLLEASFDRVEQQAVSRWDSQAAPDEREKYLEHQRAQILRGFPPLENFETILRRSTPGGSNSGSGVHAVPNYLSALREEEVGSLIRLALDKKSPALARYILASEKDRVRVTENREIAQSEPFKGVLFPER